MRPAALYKRTILAYRLPEGNHHRGRHDTMSDNNSGAKIQELIFNVRRSARYHTMRKRFFNRLRKAFLILIVLSALAACVELAAELNPKWPLATTMLAALFAIADLILNAPEGAGLHTDLARRYLELEADIAAAGENPGDHRMREFANRRLRISLEEPPIRRVLDCVCHNELVRATGHGRAWEAKLSGVRRFLANFWDVSPGKIRQAPETDEVKPLLVRKPEPKAGPIRLHPAGTTPTQPGALNVRIVERPLESGPKD